MIRKMKRRYLITNMALLSATLLVCLGILFGIFYHAQITASYAVMQKMIQEDMPSPPPGMAIEPTGDSTNGTVVPLSAVNRGNPPYWDFTPPDYPESGERPAFSMPERPEQPGGWWDETWPRPEENDPRETHPWHGMPDASGSEDEVPHTGTTAEWEGSRPFREPPEHSNPESGTWMSGQTTPAWTEETQTATETQSTQAAAPVTSQTTYTTTRQLVPVQEGHYVPDALVANIDGEGNVAAYAGNEAGASGDEHLKTVHHAMDAIQKHSIPSGTLQVGETSYRYLFSPDDDGNFRLVLLDRSQELSTLSRLLFIFLLIAVFGLLCMFGVSTLLANWTVTPVAVAWEKQKQFVADASHELKTPLAVISANTEVIQANPQGLVAEQSKWLNYIQSETIRMSKLITGLLSVARMDSRENDEAVLAPLSLSELVTNTCLVFEPIIYEHHKTLNTVIQRNVMLRADESDIRQLLSILLDNAVLHSVPAAQITVTLSKDTQGKIRLAVSNTAKDIPPYQLEHIFDRFYRIDKEGSPNGSGLGLSIARSIVRQIGGQLTVTSENSLVTFVAVFS